MEIGETVENACLREIKEETDLDVRIDSLLGVYSDPKRDPRGHTVSVIFICTTISGEPEGGDDAAKAESFKIKDLHEIKLAFDHAKVVKDALV